MSFTSKLYSLISKNRLKSIDLSRKNPELFQRKLFNELIKRGAKTEFGKEHNFEAINSIDKYGQNVPLRDYNMFEPYIERVRKQEKNVLWDTPVKWFAKSSGTSSSKSKFIPITKDSLQNCHYSGMKKMIATYIDNNPLSQLFDGDALTLGGSVTVDELGFGKSSYGDLSAVLLKNSPLFVEMRRVPKRKIALLPDFEQKVDIICKNALKYNVTNFSGVPSWNMVLFRKILDYTGKTNLKELWPNLELFMHGGINFEPYRNEYKKIISGEMNYMENYNASEGNFAFQDDPLDKSMLLLTDNGIFYEF
ncbi:MAG: GH3 auxin-responsive promoter family protein, partial [Bacteroidales bacterium]|nr:GH3 auxin-responsive promoter family protein [Bacteroidales bacterium]